MVDVFNQNKIYTLKVIHLVYFYAVIGYFLTHIAILVLNITPKQNHRSKTISLLQVCRYAQMHLPLFTDTPNNLLTQNTLQAIHVGLLNFICYEIFLYLSFFVIAL